MSGAVLDVLLILLAVFFAVHGYRQGFVIGVLSFAGLASGALLGLQLAPLLVRNFDSPAGQVFVTLVTVFGLAILGQALAAWLGIRIRHSIRNRNARIADDIGGAIVSVLAILVVIWAVAAPLGSVGLPSLAKAVRNSKIVTAVDALMPDAAHAVYDKLRETLNTSGFPDVFGGLAPTHSRPVQPPDPTLANSTVVRGVEKSVLKILGDASKTCSRRIEGSGFVFAPQHVMTNAHVVAGTRGVTVQAGDRKLAGRVVVYDKNRDLAVIYVPELTATPLKWAANPGRPEQDAIVVGYPLDGPYDAQSARIREVGKVRGPNIYENETVVREVYTIRSKVRSGNSGGPLLSSTGEVYGVIFAAAVDDDETGYALTAAEATDAATTGRTATTGVSTGACA